MAYSLQKLIWTMNNENEEPKMSIYASKLNAFIPFFGSSYCSYPHRVLKASITIKWAISIHIWTPLRCSEQFLFWFIPNAPDTFSQFSFIINSKWLECNLEFMKSTKTFWKYTNIENAAKYCETTTHQSSLCANMPYRIRMSTHSLARGQIFYLANYLDEMSWERGGIVHGVRYALVYCTRELCTKLNSSISKYVWLFNFVSIFSRQFHAVFISSFLVHWTHLHHKIMPWSRSTLNTHTKKKKLWHHLIKAYAFIS